MTVSALLNVGFEDALTGGGLLKEGNGGGGGGDGGDGGGGGSAQPHKRNHESYSMIVNIASIKTYKGRTEGRNETELKYLQGMHPLHRPPVQLALVLLTMSKGP